jgi:hypothetical protein
VAIGMRVIVSAKLIPARGRESVSHNPPSISAPALKMEYLASAA